MSQKQVRKSRGVKYRAYKEESELFITANAAFIRWLMKHPLRIFLSKYFGWLGLQISPMKIINNIYIARKKKLDKLKTKSSKNAK